MLAVLAGHALALTAFAGIKPEPRPAEIPPRPIMVSMIVAAQPPAPVVEPPPAPPPPEPAKPSRRPKPKPKPKPKPVPRPEPTPVAAAPEPTPTPPPRPPQEPVQIARAPETTPAITTVAPRFDAAYLRNPAPQYPRVSRRRGEQGQVLLRVRVTTAGRPAEVELERSSGYRRLDQAAIDTVRRWRFVPASRAGDAVEADVLVPINFRLES